MSRPISPVLPHRQATDLLSRLEAFAQRVGGIKPAAKLLLVSHTTLNNLRNGMPATQKIAERIEQGLERNRNASRTTLKPAPPSVFATPQAEQLFLDLYRKGGRRAVRHAMPEIKPGSISALAAYRGVVVDGGYENRVVREHYPTGGVDAVRAAAPWMTVSSVYNRASLLGIKRIGPPLHVEAPEPEPVERDPLPFQQARVPAGQWRAEVPRVRWVFDLGSGA